MNPKDKRNPVRKVLTRVVELMNYLPGADRITLRRTIVESRRIPQAFDGFTIVQVSDLHGRWFGARQEQLIEKVRSLDPDVILCTGDWIDTDYEGDDQTCVETAVKGLLTIAPIYSIIGNHEARAYHKTNMISELGRMGVVVLLSENVQLYRQGQSIALAGFLTAYDAPLRKDPSEYEKLKQEYRQALIGRGQQYTIAMAHRPELLDLYADLNLDLVLAGHAHGGLMKLPKGRRLLAPGQGWLPKYTHGAYRKGNTRMLVSSGLGGPRIGIAPEISQIILKRKEEEVSI